MASAGLAVDHLHSMRPNGGSAEQARYDKGSIIITSQVPVDRWHDLIGIPTLADAILDRVMTGELELGHHREARPRMPFAWAVD